MALVLSSQDRQAVGRRSAFEVRMDVLRSITVEGVGPTRVMYRSNTSWMVLQKNLEALMASGFVQQTGQGARLEYSITEKGRRVLQDYADLLGRAGAGLPEVFA